MKYGGYTNSREVFGKDRRMARGMSSRKLKLALRDYYDTLRTAEPLELLDALLEIAAGDSWDGEFTWVGDCRYKIAKHMMRNVMRNLIKNGGNNG